MKKLYQAVYYEESWLFVDDDSYTLTALKKRFIKKLMRKAYKEEKKDYTEHPEWYESPAVYIGNLRLIVKSYKGMSIDLFCIDEVDGYKIILEKKEGN